MTDGLSLKGEYISYTPHTILSENRVNGQLYNNIPKEASAISLKDSYREIEFDVKHRMDNVQFAECSEIRSVNLVLNAFQRI